MAQQIGNDKGAIDGQNTGDLDKYRRRLRRMMQNHIKDGGIDRHIGKRQVSHLSQAQIDTGQAFRVNAPPGLLKHGGRIIDPDDLFGFFSQGGEQNTRAYPDFKQSPATGDRRQQRGAVVGSRENFSSQAVPLAGVLFKKLLTALAAGFKDTGQTVVIGAMGRERLQIFLQCQTNLGKKWRLRQSVVGPRSLPLHCQYPDPGKDLQMPGHPRLPHAENGCQFLHGEFAVLKNVDNP